MKTIAFVMVCLFSVPAIGQTFEGSIKWNIKTIITDSVMKKQMEASKASMNDPANQERMKQMQKQMNDPQMKKMMESNPQMKAQMERMMAMQQTGNSGSMFPTGMLIKLKGGNSLTVMEGGMMNSEMLYQKDKNQSFMLDRQSKTVSPIPPAQPNAKPMEAKVTKTNETAKILNYTCTKYVAEIINEGKPMKQIFWTTTEVKDIDVKALAKQRMDRGKPMFYENIEGFPMRIEIESPEMKARMTMEVTEIKRGAQKAEDFIIPTDFKNIPPPPQPMR